MKLVLDTNVIVGFSLRHKGAVATLWTLWRQQKFTLVTAPSILDEVTRVLDYPRIHSRLQWTTARKQVFVATIRHKAILTDATTPIASAIRDLTDTKFLSCAIEGQADTVVTGDRHLLDLNRYQGIPIVTPQDCLQRFFGEGAKR